MRFVKEMFGGLIIIAVAGIIGLAVNSMRDKPMTLVPRVPKAMARSAAGTDQSTESRVGSSAVKEAAEEAVDVRVGGPITDAELATGELPKERVRALLAAPEVILVDARVGSEYDEAHIPGALNVPYDRLIDYYDKLVDLVPMDATVVCYCQSVSCDLSDNLAQELRLMGYERVLVYRGGIDEWEEAGFPTGSTN